jgi:hypothetical protein
MPICPKCSATIHRGAEDACPACGYDISQADDIFGYGQVEFTRVVDAAGSLTHQERIDLMRTLENLERRIRPAALCIYITDVGKMQELRTHAHWILNHARIHHPSFGKRELHKAIEDAELRERRPGERRQQEEHRQGWLASAWQSLRDYVMDALHPLPPPVKHEWMLVLVMDVQLEMACFSWGYKLDPFIDPDRINTCIKCARLQFRERAMVAGLKRVMRATVRHISSASRSVNRQLRRAQKIGIMAATLGLVLASSVQAEPETTADTPAPAARMVPAEAPDEGGMPHWRADDYRHLMAGELVTGYISLFPPKPTPEEIKAEEARRRERLREQREQRRQQARQLPRTRPPEKPEESDTRILRRYCDIYTRPPRDSALNDPQGLLSTVEREDVEHVLRTLNANASFRIYVSIVKGGQEITSELAINKLVTGTAQPCEYAVLMRFPTGNPAGIELGYQEIQLTDTQRHEWLQKVRTAAADGSADGLMEALRCLSSLITPLSADFTPIATNTGAKIKLIDIQFKESDKNKKISTRDRIFELLQNPTVVAAILYPLGILASIFGLYLFFNWLRSSSRLEDSEADIRLSSPYGAGVSRYVRYLEGTEAGKEKRLF